jgi:hypothetical protein
MRLEGGAESSELDNRYSDVGQNAVINDVFELAQADFVVCTFSSNICRLAYELRMASRHLVPELYELVSVDIAYFFQYGNPVEYTANHKRDVHPDKKSKELSFVKGDIIHIPLSITRVSEPLETATNLMTKEKGHYVRSMLRRIFMYFKDYPTIFK